MNEHICTVCFRPFTEHDEGDGPWPPPCCDGCDCGQGSSATMGDERASGGVSEARRREWLSALFNVRPNSVLRLMRGDAYGTHSFWLIDTSPEELRALLSSGEVPQRRPAPAISDESIEAEYARSTRDGSLSSLPAINFRCGFRAALRRMSEPTQRRPAPLPASDARALVEAMGWTLPVRVVEHTGSMAGSYFVVDAKGDTVKRVPFECWDTGRRVAVRGAKRYVDRLVELLNGLAGNGETQEGDRS